MIFPNIVKYPRVRVTLSLRHAGHMDQPRCCLNCRRLPLPEPLNKLGLVIGNWRARFGGWEALQGVAPLAGKVVIAKVFRRMHALILGGGPEFPI